MDEGIKGTCHSALGVVCLPAWSMPVEILSMQMAYMATAVKFRQTGGLMASSVRAGWCVFRGFPLETNWQCGEGMIAKVQWFYLFS